MNNSTVLSQHFNELSILFKEYFGDPVAGRLPFQKDTHEWLNYFFKSPIFRHIHLEYYKTDKLCVLHSNIFPEPTVDLPIMGFDVIAFGGKISGLFFDYTPTVTISHALEHCLENLHSIYQSKKRPLPEWANFFSDKFYCVTPEPSEIEEILDYIRLCVQHYLQFGKTKQVEHALNIATQNAYCIGQQKNVKTFKALSAEIGKDAAELFMKKYLFPAIDI